MGAILSEASRRTLTKGMKMTETIKSGSTSKWPEGESAPRGANDPLYADAVLIVREHKCGSISLVQRHLRIGYARASCMLEAMVGSVIAEAPPTDKLLPETMSKL